MEPSSLVFRISRQMGRMAANQKPHPPSKETGSEEVMDAKYNWIIDNTGIRLTLNIVGFVIWLLACAALLSF
jgi:hypothetical protein